MRTYAKSLKSLVIFTSLLLMLLGIGFSVNGATYYSSASGSPTTLTLWWTATNGSGSNPANFTTAGDIFTIQSGHNMTTTANWSVTGTVTINSGGTLTVAGSNTLTVGTLNVNGTYQNNSSGNKTLTNLAVGATGTYNHNTSNATLPIGTSSTTWAAASNLNITGSYTSATVFLNFIGQTFGNFTFNPTSMTNTVCLYGASGVTHIQGNFTVTNTGAGPNTLYLRQSGSQFNGELDIDGNFVLTAGILDLHNGGATPTNGTINLKGNFTLSGTSILKQTTTQSGSTVNFNFTGTTPPTQVVSIASGVQITSQATNASCAIQFNVASGATIDMGTSVFPGTLNNPTSFTLSAGAGIITANAGGLSSSGATGSIQVSGTRSYSTAANYTYNSTVATQVTGNGVTGANNLTFNNTYTTGVTFSNAIAATGTMTIATNAHVNLGTFNSSAAGLTLGGVAQGVGTYSYATTSTYFGNASGAVAVNLPIPSNLSYASPFAFPLNFAITEKDPTVTGVVTSWAISPALPTGLSFSLTTGAITGTPTVLATSATYTVTATNSTGSTTFGVVISVGNYIYAIASGNWDSGSTWSNTSGGTTCNCTPNSGEIVFIGEASTAWTVTIPTAKTATCGSLTMGSYTSATVATLNFTDGTSILNITNDLTMNRPNAAATSAVNLGAGTLTVGGTLKLANSDQTPNAGATLINSLNISTGTVNTQNLIFNGQAAAQSQVVFSGAGKLNISGALTYPYLLGTLTPLTGTVNFNGSIVAQTVPIGISAITFNNLTINNTNSGGATLSAAISSTNVTGNMSVGDVSSGSLLNTGNFNVAFGNTKTLTVTAGSTLDAGTSVLSFGTVGTAAINGTFKTANTFAFSGSTTGAINSTSTPTITLGSASTIEYNAAGTQPVTARTNYASVTLTGGSKTIPTGTTTLSKNLTINTGATYNGAANPTLNIGGNFTNNGTFTSGTGVVTFTNGQSAANTVTGASTFTNLTLNNTNGLIIANDETVTGTLTYTSGKITTGANRLIVGVAGTGGTVTGAGTGKYVYGNLRRFVPNSATPTVGYDIGDATNSQVFFIFLKQELNFIAFI